MEQSAGEIRLTSSDAEINAMLQRDTSPRASFTRHFSQGEDFFLRLGTEFQVPSFSIHHNVYQDTPDPQYITKLRGVIDTLQHLVPSIFSGLTYLFDPSEILRPAFFQLYRVAGEPYLYLMRLDLVCRPQKHRILEKGTNDTTPVYETRELMIDADIIPLNRLLTENEKTTGGVIDHMISDTWIGETGRGYFVQGIWLDTDLTKFFSKLILPAGKRVYPYYPFSSKYRTVCHHPIALDPAARRRAVPLLHRVKHFLTPHLSQIEQILREETFSEGLPAFTEIKATVPEEWQQMFTPLSMEVYLNEEEQKEFEVHEEGAG
ncbi:MAG: hypothetical protein R6U25_06235 [Alkalispirochaeta sp.]